MTLFTELALILIVTTLISFAMRFLKQPLVVGYILSGILVGPMVLNITSGGESFHLFAQVGIAILLFIVGLHLNPSVVKEIGSVSAITGITQVVLTSIIGFGIGLLLGLDKISAAYVSIALTFSSTIIILKLLSDKGHIHTLYGQIAVGMLLIQDLIATLILLFVSALSTTGGTEWQVATAQLIGKSVLLAIALFTVMKWMLPLTLKIAGKSQELLFLFAITWGLAIAGLFEWLGLSVEIGALVAGVMLSSSELVEDMSSKLRPLRDFFIIIFFVMLGSQIILSQVLGLLPEVLLLSAFVLIGNPIIVFVVLNLLGYHRRTGFLTGLTVAQISEFSLILAALGLQLGQISQETVTLITLVGLVTITGSTYLILYGETLYKKLMRLLVYLELRKNTADRSKGHAKYQALIVGYDQVGESWLKAMRKLDLPTLVVDFDPRVIAELTERHIASIYGDAGSQEFLNELPVGKLKLVIISVHDPHVAGVVSNFATGISKNCIILTFSADKSAAQQLQSTGASLVINPLAYSSKGIAKLLVRVGLNKSALKRSLC